MLPFQMIWRRWSLDVCGRGCVSMFCGEEGKRVTLTIRLSCSSQPFEKKWGSLRALVLSSLMGVSGVSCLSRKNLKHGSRAVSCLRGGALILASQLQNLNMHVQYDAFLAVKNLFEPQVNLFHRLRRVIIALVQMCTLRNV